MTATQHLAAASGHFQGRSAVLEVITDTVTDDGTLPDVVPAKRRRGRRILPTGEDKPKPTYPKAVAAPADAPPPAAETFTPMRRRG